MDAFSSIKSAIFDREERKQQYQAHIRGLNAYDRHKKYLKDYVHIYGNQRNSNQKLPVKTDQDTLREGYRFIWTEEDDENPSWEQRLVKRYYDKLFKEYPLQSHFFFSGNTRNPKSWPLTDIFLVQLSLREAHSLWE